MANLLTNGTFDADTDWTKGTGWTIASGVATHVAGTAANNYQGIAFEAGVTYRITFDLTTRAGGMLIRLTTGNSANQVNSATFTDSGFKDITLVASASGNDRFNIRANSTWDGDIDNVTLERVYDINADVAITLDGSTLSSTGDVASSGITGTLASTLDAATISGAADLLIDGDLAVTLADATLSSAADLLVAGSLAATLGDATLSSAADLLIDGDLAVTLADATLASAADLLVAGSLSSTLDAATIAAAGGATPIGGALTATLEAATLASAGTLPIEGSLAATLDAATASSAAQSPIVGSAAITLDTATLSAAGTKVTTGSLAVTLADVSLVPTGELLISGTLAATLDDATLEASESNNATLAVTLANATLFSEMWGTEHTPLPGERTPVPPRFTFSSIEGWDGVGTASVSMAEHGSSGEHHVSIVLSASAPTGVLRLRMIPTKLTKAVALEDETEEIDVSVVGGYASFVVGGFYSAIEATFTTALSAGTATITVASNVADDENFWPKETIIDMDWDGVGVASKSMPDHAGFALHHVAVACSIQPSAGSILVRGRPAGSPGGHATLCGPYYLTGTGTVNIIIAGFYDEFSIVASEAIVDGGAIQARVASVFGSPLVAQDFPLGGRLGVEVPAAATSPGSPGDFAWDTSYLYVCVDVDTWKRTALVAW